MEDWNNSIDMAFWESGFSVSEESDEKADTIVAVG